MRAVEVSSIGVDVGGTKVLAVALDPQGTIVAVERRPTPQVIDGEAPSGAAVADAVAEAVLAVAKATSAPTLRGLALGCGIPGMVDRRGVLVFAPNLHGAIGADLASLLSERLDGAVVGVDNDANCALLAEHHFGAARGVDDALLVTLGTGIGGAALIGGTLLRGANGFAAEFGHLLVDPHGPPCPCGSRGCWERYASGAGFRHLLDRAAAAGQLDPAAAHSAEAGIAAVRAGDPGAAAVLEEFSWWLARGVANLCAAFDPELVLFGGGVAQEHDLFLAPVAAHLADMVEGGRLRQPPRLAATALGARAGAIGAALVGERRLLGR